MLTIVPAPQSLGDFTVKGAAGFPALEISEAWLAGKVRQEKFCHGLITPTGQVVKGVATFEVLNMKPGIGHGFASMLDFCNM